ncbi:MAG: alpha/beta fold hydrolase [Alphaproteobacteria bacterium]|nr:alpha/beta fold hydrolase [Alphaproteobacteria bacterium]
MSGPACGARPERDLVILVHGLSRTRHSMRHLRRAAEAAGFATQCWAYPSRRHGVRELVQSFRRYLLRLGPRGGRVHFIGHSLGAILIRAALLEPVPFRIGRIVMLAPPNRGVGLVERLSHLAFLQRIFGRPSAELGPGSRFLRRLGTPAAEIGVIAGSRRFHPCNPTSWLNLALNPAAETDGTVELASTKLPGMRDFLVVDANHSFIIADDEAIEAAIAFLHRGTFPRPAVAKAT